MHDAVPVRLGETPRHLQGDVEHLVERQRAARDPLRQGLAAVVGHGDEDLAVLGLFDLMDGAQVRVIERRGGARFTEKAGLGLGIAGQLGGQEL